MVVVATEKCNICGQNSDFTIAGDAVLFREARCSHCGASLRNSDVAGHVVREMLSSDMCLSDALPKLRDKKILNSAASGAIHEALKELPGYMCGEYLDGVESGEYRGDIRCIDLKKIPFEDEAFDLVISEDVFEHIREPEEAFREVDRVLSPSGVHVFTVPYHENAKTASRKNKANRVYHGDPIRADGILVQTDFGIDIRDFISQAKGGDTSIYPDHIFYQPDEITDVDRSYEEYREKIDRMDTYFKYNSVVFVTPKRVEEGMLDFTGERFVPGIDDDELTIEHMQRYFSVAKLVQEKDVLDAACGEGYGSDYMAGVARHVTGIDIDEETIRHAQKKYAERKNLSFCKGSVTNLSMIADTSVDVVVSFETIEHIGETEQEVFLQEIKRVLRPDGLLVMSTPNTEIYSDERDYHNEYHVHEFKKDEFLSFIKETFQNIRLYHQFFEVTSVIESGDEATEITFFQNRNNYQPDGKYYIVLASNTKLPDISIASVQMNARKEYSERIARIVELQSEVEERNAHIRKLDTDIEKIQEETGNVRKELSSAQEELSSARERLSSAQDNVSSLQEALSTEQARSSRLQGELDEKIYHVEILMDELDRIKARKMYRAMNTVSRGINKVTGFPKRVHRLLSNVTPHRIRRVASYVKNEGLADGYRHAIHDYHRGMDIVKPEVDAKIDRGIGDLSMCERLVFPAWETPRVSIVIPVYNQFTYTYHCLKSILEYSGDVAYEVIVADDCSDDLTTHLGEVAENIHIVRNQENLLFLRNCNNAAKHAIGEFILFLNNDTQVQENWLEPLVALMDRDPQIGLTGSKLLYPDGTLQEAGGIIWRDGSGWNYGGGGNALASEYDYVRDVDYISGAAIMIRKSLWEEIGGFDDRFAPAYYEDTDLAFQVRQKGCRVVFQPASSVVHFEGKSNGTDLNAGIKKYQVENAAKFFKKWRTVLEDEQFENGQDVFLARNRSRNKKRIFVTDHYIPHYDNDAGGRCTYMYLLQFIHMGMHVTFLGENCARTEPYYTALTQAGIETLVGDYYYQHWEDWLKENGPYFDYVYMQRPHITLKYLDAVKKYCPGKLFYFDHDLHHIRKQREYEITGDPEYLKSAEEWKEKEFHIIESVDVVHVVGSFEEEYLKNIFPEKIVRNIPLYIYEQVPADIPKDFGKRQDILFVGGFGHPPNGDAVLWFAQEIYPKVLERYPDMVWHIVGSHPTKEIQKLAGRNIRIEGFLSDQELEHLYRTCRLAVVPLRYGAGVKGKIVEAAYYGLPVITTPIGAEGISLEEGFLTVRDSAEEIARAVIELYGDTERLKELSDAGRILIENNYSLRSVESVLGKDMSECISRR